MEKIAIIGSPGAGKTTLAVESSKILNIKVFHLDRLFWKRGWIRKSRDTRIDILNKIVQEKQWIIEGTYLNSSEPRLEKADTIIFLDTPPRLCFLRVIRRHWENSGQHRRDLPIDSTDKLTLSRILKVLFFPYTERKRLIQTLHEYDSKRIIWLHSPKEVETFLQKQATQTSALCTSPSSKSPSTRTHSQQKYGSFLPHKKDALLF